jgi:hypothetical protein
MAGWFILALIALGIVLIAFGFREMGRRDQAADVRAGGAVFVVLGAVPLVLAVLIILGALLKSLF